MVELDKWWKKLSTDEKKQLYIWMMNYKDIDIKLLWIGFDTMEKEEIKILKEIKDYIGMGFFALIVNFLGNLLLIPIYGIVGAAIATFAAHLLINVSATVYVMIKT